MKKIAFQRSWPESWKLSYSYDLLEIYGSGSDPGYANAYRNRKRYAIEAVVSLATAGARILDVAAAQGNLTLALAELGYDITWNDLRADLAEYVALKHEFGKVSYAPGNALNLDLTEAFDLVLATEIVEHVAHPDDFLRKLGNLLKPKGYLILTTPNGEYIRNSLPKFSECPDPSRFERMQFQPNADGHIFLLHRDEIASLAKAAGLEVKTIRLFTNPLTAGHMRTKPLLKILPERLIKGLESMSAALGGKIGGKLNVHMLIVLRKP